jgi:hypothetical protein
MLSSGLRRQEGGSLLTFELPAQRLRHGRYCHGSVAGAVTRSKRDRTFYASVDALGQVEAYVQSERAWAVRRAQQEGRYERLTEVRLVTEVTRGRQAVVYWTGRDGTAGRQRLRRQVTRLALASAVLTQEDDRQAGHALEPDNVVLFCPPKA